MPTPEAIPELLSVTDAIERVSAAFKPLPSEIISVSEAGGRVLAEDVYARATHPPGAVSAMDGFAVRAVDTQPTPVRLRVVGAVPAGSAPGDALAPGEAVRIFTGALLPAGADAVVIQENAVVEADSVRLTTSVREGQHVRAAGLDFAEGHRGLCKGRRLTARDLGLAAAMDVPWLPVRRRPRVAVLATGSELKLPGEPRSVHQIVGANNLMLAGLIRGAGAVPIDLGTAPDDAGSLGETIARVVNVDLVLTTGGISVGEHDLVRSVLDQNGFQLEFWRVAMRPGKPVLFGRLPGVPVLGLPGNPVSAYVCGVVLLFPAMEAMLGTTEQLTFSLIARVGEDLAENGARQNYMRAHLAYNDDGEPVVTPFATQDSAMLTTLAAADCLIIRPPRAKRIRAGDRVPIMVLSAPPFLT